MAKRTLSEWAIDIGYTDAEPSKIVTCCVYGATGVGKTRFAGTFPNPFFIDADRGLRTLKDFHHPYYSLSKGQKVFSQIMVILGDLSKKAPPFDKLDIKTIVIDSLTELANFLLVESMKYPTSDKEISRQIEDEKPVWDDYAKLSGRMDTIVKKCRDLGLNFVATAGRKLDKDETTGEMLGLPNIVGGYRDIVGHQFDEYFYLEPKTKDGVTEYRAFTAKYKYFEAKSRDGRERIVTNPTYEKLYGKEEEKKKCNNIPHNTEKDSEKSGTKRVPTKTNPEKPRR